MARKHHHIKALNRIEPQFIILESSQSVSSVTILFLAMLVVFTLCLLASLGDAIPLNKEKDLYHHNPNYVEEKKDLRI